MEVENQVSFISPMLQNTQFGNVDDETTITFKEDADTPMTIDASAPGDVIELSDDFDFDGYQVVRREFFAHTFEPSITFNNYKVYVNTACLNKFPHADCVQLLINRESHILALRPCAESERDAFAWCNTSGGKRRPRQVTGKFFFAKLFELMDWNIDYRYKLIGKVIHANDEYLIVFDLNASRFISVLQKTEASPRLRVHLYSQPVGRISSVCPIVNTRNLCRSISLTDTRFMESRIALYPPQHPWKMSHQSIPHINQRYPCRRGV